MLDPFANLTFENQHSGILAPHLFYLEKTLYRKTTLHGPEFEYEQRATSVMFLVIVQFLLASCDV